MAADKNTPDGGDDALKNLLERMPGVVYASAAGRPGSWRYLSPQVSQLLGHRAEELVADPSLWESAIHPEDAPEALASRDPAEAGGYRVEYRYCRPDGDEIWIRDDAIAGPGDDGEAIWHGQLRDITGEKAEKEGLRGEAARHEALAHLGEMGLAGNGLEELIVEAVKVAAKLDGVTDAFLWEKPPHGDVLMLHNGLRMPTAPNWRALAADPTTHAGAVAESGSPVCVDDWEDEARFTLPPAGRDRGIRSTVAVPVEIPGQFLGVLDVHSSYPAQFHEADQRFLEAVARVLVDAQRRGSHAEELKRETLHDSVTGLPNRLAFIEEANRALARGFASASSTAVLYCDLDRFQLINDSLGHEAGDELLKAVGPRLRTQVRPGDMIAHFGGDEYAILLANIDDDEAAKVVARRIIASFKQGFPLNGVDQFTTISVGVAIAPAGTARPGDAEALLRDADAAMYKAKDSGRSRWEIYDHRMRTRATKRLAVERELHRALEEDELIVHYQPVIETATREIHSVEALVRWHHPRRGLLPPAEFISVAEDSGLIAAVGDFVLQAACEQTLAWNTLRPDERPIQIAVNLSPRQLAHPEMTDTVSRVLGDTGLAADQLILEITESLLVEKSGVAELALNALHDLGVELVLDDFGTGYSSLAYLDHFPIDGLKVDRSFVAGLGAGVERSAIVQAIVGMARALSLSVVAEGVETVEQLTELERMECDYIQGFLFSQPLPAEAVMPLLEAGVPDLQLEGSGPQLDACSVKTLD